VPPAPAVCAEATQDLLALGAAWTCIPEMDEGAENLELDLTLIRRFQGLPSSGIVTDFQRGEATIRRHSPRPMPDP